MGSRRIIGLLLKSVTVLLLIVIGVPALFLTYQQFVPHLLFNETTRGLYQYRWVTRQDGDVSLIPGFFQGGEAKREVEARLLSGDLDAWNTDYQTLPPGATTIQVFRLVAGARGVSCGNELFLTIGYNEADLLTSATVSQEGACL